MQTGGNIMKRITRKRRLTTKEAAKNQKVIKQVEKEFQPEVPFARQRENELAVESAMRHFRSRNK
jgi:hypothetical protein